jgi:hypothetical protein
MGNHKPTYSLQLKGINYVGALLAFLAQKSGINVNINLEKLPSAPHSPELSSIAPSSYAQLPGAKLKRQSVLKISTLTPHLFYPRRVLMVSENSQLKKLQNIFDILTKREREACSLPVNLYKNKTYHALSPKFKSAILVYEYQFDRNRAIIELLKKAKSAGATVSKKYNHDIKILEFTPESKTHTTLFIGNHKWAYPNDIRFSSSGLSIYLQKWNEGTRIGIILYNTKSNKEKIRNMAFDVLSRFEIKLTDEHKSHLENFIMDSDKANAITEPSLFELPKQLRNLLKQASKETNSTIRLSNGIEKNGISPFIHSTFRSFQQQCDEKFDLAKQTGIDYSVFSNLYYRYPCHIDEMIEEAYKMMNTTRDPKLITKQIEESVLNSEKRFLFE